MVVSAAFGSKEVMLVGKTFISVPVECCVCVVLFRLVKLSLLFITSVVPFSQYYLLTPLTSSSHHSSLS